MLAALMWALILSSQSMDPADAARVTLKNANMLLQFQNADAGISPTHWQASTFPQHIRDKIHVIHDGIDTEVLKPNPEVRFTLDSGRVLTRDDDVVTFVNRALRALQGLSYVHAVAYLHCWPQDLTHRCS